MDGPTRDKLASFLRDVRELPNEAAKTNRFSSLVGELYPGTSAVKRLSGGIEKAVRIDFGDKTKRGRIDAYYGNAIIEFENSMKATEKDAIRQLREYSAATWGEEGSPYRPLLCVATDGLVWKTFRPRLPEGHRGKPKPDDVSLDSLASFELSERSLGSFWIWLTSFLFRDPKTLPTAERFRLEFGSQSLAFGDAMDALSRSWEIAQNDPESLVAFDTWAKYLTVTYGEFDATRKGRPSPEQVHLFLKHTYLASVAKLLIWASLSGGKTTHDLADVAKEVLSGAYFRAQGIENLVEDDFFQWVRRAKAWEKLAPVWERILVQMQGYDLARLSQDVLKGVYQELVDPKDRHDLGEYYTPEWLCERIVDELLPKRGFASVLDPTCGSGSFLRAVIAHELKANPSGGDATRLREILSNVAGIDIHPLAVTIARATYVLAIRSLLKATKRPVQIPVYLADALFLPAEVKQLLFGDKAGFEIRLGKDRRVSMSAQLVENPEFFDPAIDACAKVAIDHAVKKDEDRGSLKRYLGRVVPDLVAHKEAEDMVDALWKFTEELADLIRRQENSIWAFIVKNAYRPAMLRNRFDYILGNPPWLSYRYIADPEYQDEVKRRAVVEYAIAPDSKKLMTQMELATVFLAHTLTTFGRVGCKLGFVMPRSILSADQHEKIRQRDYKAPITIDGYWDLLAVAPVFSVPSCVLFATRTKAPPRRTSSYTLPAEEWEGKLADRDEPWHVAKANLTSRKLTARLIYLGGRSALSTSKGASVSSRSSPYAVRFRQGATIVPRNCYFVRVQSLDGSVDPDRVYHAETDPEQAKQAKPPYDDVKMRGEIEGRFLFSTALARHLYPFALLDPATIALPIAVDNENRVRMRTAKELKKEGFREFAHWMDEVERIWKKKRAGKAKSHTAYEWLDYSGKLTNQDLNAPFLVLYNAAGTNLAAAAVARKGIALPFIVEHKLYWCGCVTQAEADYLVAILNSDVVNEAIKPFQSMGLLGERDIEKKVLEVPIPIYTNEHRELAALGAKAREEAARFIGSATLSRSLGRNRGEVRKAIASTLEKIDAVARELLAAQS